MDTLSLLIFCSLLQVGPNLASPQGHYQEPRRNLYRNQLTITTKLVEPYMMKNPRLSNSTSDNNSQYYGYLAELLEKLSEAVGFSYTLHEVADGSFGFRRDDGTWDGMIGEIHHGQVDMAVAPIFPTRNRLKVVDFSQHFLNVEATILIRKPPVGVRPKLHKALDLLEQNEIKYGLWDTGILIRAFRRSNETLYKMMWRYINRFTPSTFTDSNKEGIDRVRNEKYAFILPHPIGEYVAMKYPCDLMTVDRFLLKKGYAFAVKKNSPILSKLNQVLNSFKRSGYLDKLYHKWWVEGNECGIQSSKMYSRNAASYTTFRASKCFLCNVVAVALTLYNIVVSYVSL